jgi:hypothetical protein
MPESDLVRAVIFPQPRLSLQKAKEKTVEKARKKVAEMKFGL